MIFDHAVQDLNLIITSLEHKIRDMQLLVQKLTIEGNKQLSMDKDKTPIEPVADAQANS